MKGLGNNLYDIQLEITRDCLSVGCSAIDHWRLSELSDLSSFIPVWNWKTKKEVHEKLSDIQLQITRDLLDVRDTVPKFEKFSLNS